MAGKQKKAEKWHVYQLLGNYHILSDSQLEAMDDEQRGVYKLVKGDFDTDSDAWAYSREQSGYGVVVPKGKPAS